MHPDVPEAQDGRAVGHDRHRLAQRGVVVDLLGVGLDLVAHGGDARRVDLAHVADALDRHRAAHADLAAAVQLEYRVVDGVDTDAVDRVGPLHDLGELLFAVDVQLELADVVLARRANLDDVADVGTALADGLGELANLARLVADHRAEDSDLFLGAYHCPRPSESAGAA